MKVINVLIGWLQLIICKYSTTKGSGNKIYESADDAVRDIPDGAKILFGGFGLCGIPENLINSLIKKGTKNITAYSNNGGKAT